MRVAATLAAVTVVGATLAAHEGDARKLAAPGALSIWDLAAVALLAAGGGLYARGVARMRARGAVQRHREPLAFAGGGMALLVAVLPPLDALASSSSRST